MMFVPWCSLLISLLPPSDESSRCEASPQSQTESSLTRSLRLWLRRVVVLFIYFFLKTYVCRCGCYVKDMLPISGRGSQKRSSRVGRFLSYILDCFRERIVRPTSWKPWWTFPPSHRQKKKHGSSCFVKGARTTVSLSSSEWWRVELSSWRRCYYLFISGLPWIFQK